MAKFTSSLEGLRVAAPCPADWEGMVGDERVRFCGQCELHVYNLSGMTRREAESLVTRAEGRLCVRFYMRADGSILTRNCPVGLRALKQRASRITRATLSAVLGFFAGLGLNFGLGPAPQRRVMGQMVAPPARAYDAPPPPAPPAPDVREVEGEAEVEWRPRMGKVAPKMGRMAPGAYAAGDVAAPVRSAGQAKRAR